MFARGFLALHRFFVLRSLKILGWMVNRWTGPIRCPSSVYLLRQPRELPSEVPDSSDALLVAGHLALLTSEGDVPVRRPGDDHPRDHEEEHELRVCEVLTGAAGDNDRASNLVLEGTLLSPVGEASADETGNLGSGSAKPDGCGQDKAIRLNHFLVDNIEVVLYMASTGCTTCTAGVAWLYLLPYEADELCIKPLFVGLF